RDPRRLLAEALGTGPARSSVAQRADRQREQRAERAGQALRLREAEALAPPRRRREQVGAVPRRRDRVVTPELFVAELEVEARHVPGEWDAVAVGDRAAPRRHVAEGPAVAIAALEPVSCSTRVSRARAATSPPTS